MFQIQRVRMKTWCEVIWFRDLAPSALSAGLKKKNPDYLIVLSHTNTGTGTSLQHFYGENISLNMCKNNGTILAHGVSWALFWPARPSFGPADESEAGVLKASRFETVASAASSYEASAWTDSSSGPQLQYRFCSAFEEKHVIVECVCQYRNYCCAELIRNIKNGIILKCQTCGRGSEAQVGQALLSDALIHQTLLYSSSFGSWWPFCSVTTGDFAYMTFDLGYPCRPPASPRLTRLQTHPDENLLENDAHRKQSSLLRMWCRWRPSPGLDLSSWIDLLSGRR